MRHCCSGVPWWACVRRVQKEQMDNFGICGLTTLSNFPHDQHYGFEIEVLVGFSTGCECSVRLSGQHICWLTSFSICLISQQGSSLRCVTLTANPASIQPHKLLMLLMRKLQAPALLTIMFLGAAKQGQCYLASHYNKQMLNFMNT